MGPSGRVYSGHDAEPSVFHACPTMSAHNTLADVRPFEWTRQGPKLLYQCPVVTDRASRAARTARSGGRTSRPVPVCRAGRSTRSDTLVSLSSRNQSAGLWDRVSISCHARFSNSFTIHRLSIYPIESYRRPVPSGKGKPRPPVVFPLAAPFGNRYNHGNGPGGAVRAGPNRPTIQTGGTYDREHNKSLFHVDVPHDGDHL